MQRHHTLQLDEAKRVAGHLQLVLKDTERQGDDLRVRCEQAEQAASQYRTERDALQARMAQMAVSNNAVSSSSFINAVDNGNGRNGHHQSIGTSQALTVNVPKSTSNFNTSNSSAQTPVKKKLLTIIPSLNPS